MGLNRVSWRAECKAYSLSPVMRGSLEKVPMQPRRVGESICGWSDVEMVFQVTKRGVDQFWIFRLGL